MPGNMRNKLPEWRIPANIQELVATDEDGIWEDTRWDPLLLTVMAGTSYDGRDIPLAWQIEFDPGDERLNAANEEIAGLGIEPDGYGWSRVIQSVVARQHPEIVQDLHFGDTELSTCVIWVESESNCRSLISVVWSLFHNGGSIRRALTDREAQA